MRANARGVVLRLLGSGRTLFEIALIALVLLLWLHPVGAPVRRREAAQVVCRVSTTQKVVALTFDDGPHPAFTPEILGILDRFGVKATFFMIGREMEKHPEIVRQVVACGHVIANHTYSHPHDIQADTQAQMILELDKCEEVIEKMTGRRAGLFRPPRGVVDGTVLRVADEKGYRTILWTVCADHHDAPTPELMAQRVLRHTQPGSIILAHDGNVGTRWKDVKVTPLIIEELQRQGYRFLTVPELLALRR